MNIAQAKTRVSVEEVVGTRVELQRHGTVLVGLCPFHEDNGRPNLVVFPRTQTWQCFACGAQGDVIDFLTRSKEITVREAIALIGRGNVSAAKAPRRLPVPRQRIAPPDDRNTAYRELIAWERLSDFHRAALLRRGFTPQEIGANQYRTHTPGRVPEGLKPEHVPGFYHENGTWLVNGPPGLLIPVRDREGRIAGCQVRPDHALRGKYLWLSSSGKSGGASSGAPCHYARADGTQIWITEGPLKADMVAARLGQPCLGVAGVANWRSAMPLLGGVREVVLAFDEDQPDRAREAVEVSEKAFVQALTECGAKVLKATWKWAEAKGIDDALQAGAYITVA